MSASILVDVLTFFHIFSAMAWLGGSLVFLVVIGPILPKLSPPARSEVVASLLPRFSGVMTMFGVLTLIFGVTLATAIAYPDYSQLSATNPWGRYITIGALLAIVAALEGTVVLRRNVNKIAGMARELRDHPGTAPPAEMGPLQRTIVQQAMLGVALLVATLTMMVAAAGA